MSDDSEPLTLFGQELPKWFGTVGDFKRARIMAIGFLVVLFMGFVVFSNPPSRAPMILAGFAAFWFGVAVLYLLYKIYKKL